MIYTTISDLVMPLVCCDKNYQNRRALLWNSNQNNINVNIKYQYDRCWVACVSTIRSPRMCCWVHEKYQCVRAPECVHFIWLLYLAVKLAGCSPPPTLRSHCATTPVTFGATTLWFLTRFWQFLVRWRALDLFFLKHPKLSKSVQKRKSYDSKRIRMSQYGISDPGGNARPILPQGRVGV